MHEIVFGGHQRMMDNQTCLTIKILIRKEFRASEF